MKSRPSSSILAALALLTLTAAPAFSAIVITLPTATVAGNFVITQDINFTITAKGAVEGIVFDEWVTSDGTRSGFNTQDLSPLNYSLNSGTTTAAGISIFQDNVTSNIGILTPNDGYLFFSEIPVVAGDLFSVKAGSYILPAGSMKSGFNPLVQQTFTGNAYLSGGEASVRLSANTPVGSVPEPGSAALGALAGLTLLRRRRRVA